VGQHDGVVVHIDDAALRGDLLGDLVGVVGGGQAGADVQELADAGLAGQVADGTGQKRPGGAGDVDDPGEGLTKLLGDLAVGGEVVLAAQPVVPDSGRVGNPALSSSGSWALEGDELSVMAALVGGTSARYTTATLPCPSTAHAAARADR
jgi:hypothetical protein